MPIFLCKLIYRHTLSYCLSKVGLFPGLRLPRVCQATPLCGYGVMHNIDDRSLISEISAVGMCLVLVAEVRCSPR